MVSGLNADYSIWKIVSKNLHLLFIYQKQPLIAMKNRTMKNLKFESFTDPEEDEVTPPGQGPKEKDPFKP